MSFTLKTIFFFIAYIFPMGICRAELIELHSGQKIQGEIVFKDQEAIKVDQGYALPLTYYWNEIKMISVGSNFKAKRFLPASHVADSLESRGIELIDKNRINEGFVLLQEAIKIDPTPMRRLNYASILFGNGVYNFKEGNRLEAMRILKEAKNEISQSIAGFDPQNDKKFIAQAYFLLGEISLYGFGDVQSAKKFYTKSLSYIENQAARAALIKLQ